MSAVERNILTIFEPTIELDELSMPDVESGSENSQGAAIKEKPSKFTTMLPFIKINEFKLEGGELQMLNLDCSGFYPTIRFSFFDRTAMFTARYFPKDGDIIQFFLRSAGDEETFKPIRMDFTIEDIKPLGGGGTTAEAPLVMIEGRIKVPNLFTEKVQFQDNTSFEALSTMAEELGLGYASNIEETADQQIWTNPYDTAEKFIQDITSNAYLNDESFFTAYIDPYYYLTFVDANKLFDQDTELETSEMYSKNAMGTMGSGDPENPDDENFAFPNLLSNRVIYQNTARYITLYQQVNKSGKISKDNGYKRYTQYWDLQAKEFVNEFVDPITNDTEGMIPVTKGRLVDGEVEGPRNDQVKYKFLGTQGDNMHENYYYAEILNYQNLQEIEKFGMTLELNTVNTALLRFQRIYIEIFETSQNAKSTLMASNVDDAADVPEGAAKREPQEVDGVTLDDPSQGNQQGIKNEYLSGFYVITGMEYFQEAPGLLRQKIHLRRREATPST
tara:strand:+ start:5175 stop:6683 length:1509 start_codon:yes stop_codon:yes gene_type:complete